MNKTDIQNLFKYLKNKDFINYNLNLENLFKNKILTKEKYLNYKGYYYFVIEEIDEAITFFEKSIDIKPEFDSCLNLGASFLKKKKFNDGLKFLKKSLEIKDNFEDTYILISKALFSLNKNKEAYDILEKGLKKVKDQNKLCYEIGINSIQTKDFYKGIVAFNKIIKTNSKNYRILNLLGVCYEQISQYDQAEKYFRSAIDLKADYSEAICNLANILRGRANFNEAKELYLKALSLNFQKETVYRYLSTICSFSDSDNKNLLLEMEQFKNSELFLSSSRKEELYFALFKAYEDMRDTNRSKDYLIKSNQEVEKKIEYNHEVIKNQFKTLKNIFTPEFIKKQSCNQLDGKKVIFILGMPRSGTTLVEQIISSHTKVFSAGELFYFQKHLKEMFPYNEMDKFYDDVKLNFKDKKKKLGKLYLEDINLLSSSLIVTDKLPFNFIFIGFIKCIFKDVKIIHCKRESIETCFSIFKNFFPHQDIKFAYNQKNLTLYYKEYESLMNYWNEVFDNQIFNVEYNQLVNNQKKITEDLLNYCELEWDDKCLEFYKNKSNVQTLSTGQVRKPIYSSSISSWKKYEDVLQDLIKGLS